MLIKLKIGNRTKMISEHRKNRDSICYKDGLPMTSQHVEPAVACVSGIRRLEVYDDATI